MEHVKKPVIGKIVHYQSYGSAGGEHKSAARAAIISALHEDEKEKPGDPTTKPGEKPGDPTAKPVDAGAKKKLCVSLVVFNPTGLFFIEHVDYSEAPKAGCWSYIPQMFEIQPT